MKMKKNRFIKKDNFLLYNSPYSEEQAKGYLNAGKLRVYKTFEFKKKHLFPPDLINSDLKELDELIFIIAKLEGDYYKFNKDILGIDVNLFIHKDIEINESFFIVERRTSIFKSINKFVKEDIYIGNDSISNLPIEIFLKFIKDFPNRYEFGLYIERRLSLILENYFDTVIDAKKKYENYMNKKISYKGDDLFSILKDQEKDKYTFILNKLKKMLNNEENYNETVWQTAICRGQPMC